MQVLDTKDLFCPEPLMLLHNKVREMQKGEQLTMLATDPSAERDVKKFCTFLNHQLLAFEKEGELLTFLIEKGGK